MTANRSRILDLFRAMLCIAVLLYHLDILKGGFLAVCAFFTLSAFLTCKSLSKKSFKDLPAHYLKRFKNIYFPLLVVVLSSVAVISLNQDINWLNLKPETTSVLLGYNNFWQLTANLDYFARHTDSPFMHFWYIAILLQFELVFPVAFMITKKIGEKLKSAPAVIYTALAVAASVYFVISFRNLSLTEVYYGTFTRVYALIIGVALYCYEDFIKHNLVNCPRSIILGINIFCFAALAAMFVFCGPDFYFPVTMILASLLSCDAIMSSLLLEAGNAPGFIGKLVSYIASISYEVYLVQYPILYLVKNLSEEETLSSQSVLIIIVLSFVFAAVLKMGFAVLNAKRTIAASLCFSIVCGCGLLGGYQFAVAKDYTEELKALEAELAANEDLMAQRQNDFENKEKLEATAWAEMLAAYEKDKDALGDMVKNLRFTALGDSVMLGASSALYQNFPNCYVEAGVSRTAYVAEGYLTELISKGMLADIVIFHYGTNGDAPQRVKDRIMEIVADKQVYWINVSNDSQVHVNARIEALADQYDNLTMLDWKAYSDGHPEYFGSDGIHLNAAGKEAYSQLIYDALYKYCEEKFLSEREAILAQHEAEMRNRIDFFGNGMLASMYSKLSQIYPSGAFVSDKDMNVSSLIERLRTEKEEGTLASRVVLCFDSDVQLTSEDIMNIISVGGIFELNIITTSEATHDAAMADKIQTPDSICVRPFFIDIREHHDYFAPDRKNLSAAGRDAVAAIISENI